MIKFSIFLSRRIAILNSKILSPLMVNDPAGHPVCPVQRVPFSPGIGYCILDAARTVMQPAACKQRASGRSVGRSLLAPRFPLACPRVILHAAGAPRRQRQRQNHKDKPSATIDTSTHVSDAARTRASWRRSNFATFA